ncbi:hypothetical protein MRX96_014199 [Rhipicephalus microplus]
MPYAERVFSKVWVYDKASIKWRSASYPAVAFALHQRTMQFVKNLQYFVTVQTTEQSSNILQDREEKARTIDQVLELHTALIVSFVNLSMLINYPVFKLIHEKLQQCLQFDWRRRS